MKTIQLLFVAFTTSLLISCNSSSSQPEHGKDIEGVWRYHTEITNGELTIEYHISHTKGDTYEVKHKFRRIFNEKSKRKDEISDDEFAVKFFPDLRIIGLSESMPRARFSKDFKTLYAFNNSEFKKVK